MSNSGEYVDDDGKQVFGTPVRVAKYLRQIAGQYFGKQIDLYFSDLSAAKTAHLENLMPGETRNFHYHITTEDGNELAKRIGNSMINGRHYLLVYDPFQATIDWNALFPYINNWCEIIINHMVSDSMRAVKMVKKDAARNKYEQTYLTELENLIPYKDKYFLLLGDLKNAHDELNCAVMEAYGMSIKDTTESTCVAELMRMYQKLTQKHP